MRNGKMKKELLVKVKVLSWLETPPKSMSAELISLQGMHTLLLLEPDLCNFLLASLTKGYNWNLGR